jgi:hypothetical protein
MLMLAGRKEICPTFSDISVSRISVSRLVGLEDISVSRLLMDNGILRRTLGGWLDLLCVVLLSFQTFFINNSFHKSKHMLFLLSANVPLSLAITQTYNYFM